MSQIEDGMTTEEAAIVEHVAETWHLFLALPAEEQWTVTQFFAGCYDWSEMETDATAQWRATLAPSDHPTAISMAAMDRMCLIAGVMTEYDTLDDRRKQQMFDYVQRLLDETRKLDAAQREPADRDGYRFRRILCNVGLARSQASGCAGVYRSAMGT